MKLFKLKFGDPKKSNTIIAIGDWSETEHRPFHEPTKGIGFRRMFRKAGYKVFLVHEYNTSKKCSNCGNECENYLRVDNPRPYRRHTMPTVIRHGLLRCNGCHQHWNRNVNGPNNICKISINALYGYGRPEHLQYRA